MLENFPGSIKKQSKELKLTHTQKKYFVFQKEAIYAGAGTLQSPCYLNLVPRALFTGFGGGALSQRFGHPRVLGIPIPISLAFWASPVGDAQNADHFDFA